MFDNWTNCWLNFNHSLHLVWETLICVVNTKPSISRVLFNRTANYSTLFFCITNTPISNEPTINLQFHLAGFMLLLCVNMLKSHMSIAFSAHFANKKAIPHKQNCSSTKSNFSHLQKCGGMWGWAESGEWKMNCSLNGNKT